MQALDAQACVAADGSDAVRSMSQSDRSLSQSLSQTLPQRFADRAPGDPVAVVAARPWVRRDQVEAAILHVCRGQFTAGREIARRLGRSFGTIRKNYIPRLVAAGRLEPKDLETPTSPDQAYRTVEDDS